MAFLRSTLSSKRTILTLLVLFTIVTRLALALRPETQLTERLYQEDAFYALDVGNHLAHGQGFSVDGVHPTNGVQPLIVYFYALCFKIAGNDKWLGVRITFGLVALFESLCVLLIYQTINTFKRTNPSFSYDPALIGAALWAFLLSNLIHNAIGLEAGLYAMLILLSTFLYGRILRMEREGRPPLPVHWMLLGIALGFTILARIDAVFLLGAIIGVDAIRRRGGTLVQRLLPSIFIGFIALMVSLPWWLYNLSTFGSLMPISGQSESLGSHLMTNIGFASTVLANISFVLFYLPTDYPPGLLSTGIALGLIAVAFFTIRRTDAITKLRQKYDLTALMVLAIMSVCLIFYYTVIFSAPHFIGRYFHPIRIAAIILAAMLTPIIVEFVRKKGRKSILTIGLSLFVAGGIGFNVAHYVYNFTISSTSPLYWAGVWAHEHPQYKLGMTSSGTANFISGTVINLDGKVNYDALRARKSGTIGEYIIHSGINVLLDMDSPSISEAEAAGATFVPIDTFKHSIYYLRK